MKRSGFTLIELLLALAGTVVITAAVLNTYSTAVKVGPAIQAGQSTIDEKILFQDKVTDILTHVYVKNNGATIALTAGGQSTYFTTDPQVSANSGLAGGGNAGSNSAGASGSTLVFTALGEPTNQAALKDPSNDFTQQNQIRGPQGGMIEYSISLNAVGSAGDKKGIFMRMQRPADADPTQGGDEWLALPDIDSLLFEFWDGTTWQQSWDTTTQTPIRLPAAVRVTYAKGSDTPTVFVVQLPLSDATPADPVTNYGSGLAGGQ